MSRYTMPKDKHKHTYNVTIEYDPIECTTDEQCTMCVFSIGTMNSTYSASVDDHTQKQGDHAQ